MIHDLGRERLDPLRTPSKRLFLATALLLIASSARAQSDKSPAAVPAPAPLSAPAPTSPPSPPAATPSPASAPPLEASPPPAAGTGSVTPAEADRGDRGESCRAHADCKTGLACRTQVCVAFEPPPGPAEPASSERSSTIDLDMLFYNAAAPVVALLPANGTPVPSAVAFNQSYDSVILGIREVRPQFRFDIELPFVSSFQGNTPGGFGNIAFGFYYRHDFGTLKLDIGGIVELPTAPADPAIYVGSPGVSALVTPGPAELVAARGGDRAWLWIPHYIVPLAPSARLASAEGGIFSEATELTFAPMIATDAGVSNVLVPVLQLSEEVAAHASVLRGGVRAEVVGAFANVGSAGYLSLMPFVGVGGKYGFFDLGALFDVVNAPAPGAGSGSPNWGLRLRGGLHF